MTLLTLAYLGGVLTIVSPCILPVLPFVFARADRPFGKSVLPMLIGMALTFAVVATLAAVAGSWVVDANTYGRAIAMALLAVFGLTLIFPALADRLTAPLVGVGAKLSQSASIAGPQSASILPSFLLGVATGFLWAPCAGPVLGLILTGAALNGANVGTTFLLLAYAAGAVTSLALALAVGGRVFAAMKRSLGAGEWIRRGLGVAVLAAIVVIGLGLDTGFLTRISLSDTALEQSLVDRLKPSAKTADASGAANVNLGVEGGFPSLAGATDWLNSPPLTPEGLRGKVVVVDFWTYSCINCLRSIPYIRAWAEKYKAHGLVVIGVHTPEFAFERNVANVRAAVSALKIGYPVAIDNDYKIWRAFDNEYWPAHYFIDAQGHIRHSHFGEGNYDESERVIQQLLTEAGNKDVPTGIADVNASGAEAAPSSSDQSPETYVGYNRADNFVSPGGLVPDESHVYTAAAQPRLNQWSLSGDWTDTGEHAALNQPDGRIIYRFHARDLHLVLGPPPDGKPVRFQVTIDGAAPGEDRGADVDADGQGVVDAQRLYQLVRQSGMVKDRTFTIEFLDPGVQAFAFTFG
ncbi:MAG TPA: cytochrome c biogenesis protein DipZ [Xanthobacteraceae bacterium]|jgi:cytochrome c biogenesis protein CcdA/thiol-disulfide isomerase/thioredoxin|nr:cytochrome c biogenesis protein DipZ [Xanthobacteraceae bacterium]